MRVYKMVEAVIQKSGQTWWAGCGAVAHEGTALIGTGRYLMEEHKTKREARAASIELAKSYRNDILTMGGCTFETLPKIKLVVVGGAA